jgi:hypothetical protein
VGMQRISERICGQAYISGLKVDILCIQGLQSRVHLIISRPQITYVTIVYHETSSKHIAIIIPGSHTHTSSFAYQLPQHENFTGRADMLPRSYCNGFDQRIARQQLGKHLPLVLYDNNGESNFVAIVTVRC